MRITILILVLFIFFGASAQSFKARADSLYGIKKYAEAAPLYLQSASAAEFKGTKASNYYDAACCLALSGAPDSAFSYLNKAVALGWNNKEHLQKDSDLNSLHDDRQWKELLNSIKDV